MGEGTGLDQKMAEIGGRFLERTLRELDQLHELLDKARTGDTASIKDIERTTHKIAGSGGMFGFDSISECAHEIEMLAERCATDPQGLQDLAGHLARLEDEVRAAARARAVE